MLKDSDLNGRRLPPELSHLGECPNKRPPRPYGSIVLLWTQCGADSSSSGLGRELAGGSGGGGMPGRLIWKEQSACRGMASKIATKKAWTPLKLTD